MSNKDPNPLVATKSSPKVSAATMAHLVSELSLGFPSQITEAQASALADDGLMLQATISMAIMHRLGQLGGADWVDRLLAREKRYLKSFFHHEYKLNQLADVLKAYGREQVSWWLRMGLQVCYLPKMTINRDTKLSGMKANEYIEGLDPWWPGRGDQIMRLDNDGKLQPIKKFGLEGGVFLFDTRPMPAWNHIYPNEFAYDEAYLEPLIRRMRKESLLAVDKGDEFSHPVGPGSRTYISRDQWQNVVRPAVSQLLDLNDDAHVRSETIFEAALIPVIYHDTFRNRVPGIAVNTFVEEMYSLSVKKAYPHDAELTGEKKLYTIANSGSSNGFANFQWGGLLPDQPCGGVGIRPIAVLAPSE